MKKKLNTKKYFVKVLFRNELTSRFEDLQVDCRRKRDLDYEFIGGH